MSESRQRRSPRIALRVPIRVFGQDSKGVNFFYDSSTLVVNEHGAKIRIAQQVDPVGDIVILCQATDEGEKFRLVPPTGESTRLGDSRAVECLNPAHNIWGIQFPDASSKDLAYVYAMVQCPDCGIKDLIQATEADVERALKEGGFQRECRACGFTGAWVDVPYAEA